LINAQSTRRFAINSDTVHGGPELWHRVAACGAPAGGAAGNEITKNYLLIEPFTRWIKSHLLFAGIIRSSPFSPR